MPVSIPTQRGKDNACPIIQTNIFVRRLNTRKSMDGELSNLADTLMSVENYCVHFIHANDATSMFTLHRKNRKHIQSGFTGQLTTASSLTTYGNSTQSAVIKSVVSTALKAITFS